MKTKTLLIATLLGVAAISANAGVRFGVSVTLPSPVIVSTPVVYATPVTPAPVTVIQTIPASPGVDYVWMPGYWAYGTTGRAWVSGAWHYRPAHVVYAHHRVGHHR
jgi:WXXGXW repeat (2 copies)